ncbi:MAG: RecQ family ATP-dependent DNA helicase [Bacteroidales bacterium]|nr:RecQ family ATP-dependent DNA helicase [Bacteroidales bacterium]MCF8391193.1 RecQ family ATP-dependent DNA helicase [Bacteroidales bacterium]
MTDFRQILLKYWGYSDFRPMQEDIIQSVFDGKDTLGLLPTGGGKSITFQVPAMAKDGVCIVITPLIALMKDQVSNLQNKGIKAVAVNSSMSKEEIDIALDNCIFGDYKFLYLSPERLTTELFKVRLEKMKVNLIAIDESHCISQWGYDFRPSYLNIADIRELLPEVPVLALTATATPKVVEDIMEKLKFRERNLFQKSFERSNLTYRVDNVEDKNRRLLNYLNDHKGTAIVYVRNRKKTKEVAEFLKLNNISSDYYHAGINHESRSSKQEKWQKGNTRVIVATNAFGMGIDKPDVRLVVHIDLPDSIEAYFQEAGRAGRDEKAALAVLIVNAADKRLARQRVANTFPEISVIKDIYQALGNYFQLAIGSGKGQSFDFILFDFLHKYKFNALIAHSSIKILQREGYIDLSDEFNNPSRIHFKIGRDDLYKFQVSNSKYDGFIKLILRSYTGLFSSYVAIDENLLARRSLLSRDDVYKYLVRLSSSQIIDYIPMKKNPVITYIEERLDKSNLYISAESYRFLKEKFVERLDGMLLYGFGITKCRNQILLDYFGEKKTRRCGKCDVCLQRNELDMSSYEFDLILEDIKKELKANACLIPELSLKVKHPEDKFIKVFRWLLDHGKIEKDIMEKYLWKQD